jgi:UDP-N-acetylglucosamine 2-epimerase (non-hydrolysing)
MPEEINRMVTDCLTDYFFTTSETANENLKKLGVPDNRIFFVGNVMIDTLMANRERFRKPAFFDDLRLEAQNYLVLTLHRPANVDEADRLKNFLSAIIDNSGGMPIIFPVHPRTAKIISESGFKNIINSPNSAFTQVTSLNNNSGNNLFLTQPLGYLEFNYLVERSKAVITDSGGITEETTVMGVPCMTLRDNTERPETITLGTNELVGTDPRALKTYMDRLLEGKWKKGRIPELWDGKTADRILQVLLTL